MSHSGIAILGPDKRLSPKSFCLWCEVLLCLLQGQHQQPQDRRAAGESQRVNPGQRPQEAEPLEMTKGCGQIKRIGKVESMDSPREIATGHSGWKSSRELPSPKGCNCVLIIMTKGITTNVLKEEKVYFGLQFQRDSVSSWERGMAGQEQEAG